MTPEALAALHQRAFTLDRAWNADEFADFLRSDLVTLFSEPGGFALTRTLAGESELLTLAVDPAARRQGIARRLVTRWLDAATPEAEMAFLEVAEDNAAAIALYADAGFVEAGRRPAYYRRQSAPDADALLLHCVLPRRHAPQ